jgi:hypothetical protein
VWINQHLRGSAGGLLTQVAPGAEHGDQPSGPAAYAIVSDSPVGLRTMLGDGSASGVLHTAGVVPEVVRVKLRPVLAVVQRAPGDRPDQRERHDDDHDPVRDGHADIVRR